MESVIKWQTGKPKEDGWYFIQYCNNTFDIQCFLIGFGFLEKPIPHQHIVAWCPLSEIEPYKE